MINQWCFARLKTQSEYMCKKNVTCLHPTLSTQESSEASLPSASRLLRDATLIQFRTFKR